ncbi:hypothetical protein BD410DRAFT_646025 [Rickenella mellea]|uniref:PAS domain-containing protein n=1 Tax=Rickenella mellea TaxID=50990 RepID=A0A4Y7PM81_9AGAM|nr:hypothetical protein BD410DRAFT_646025 [Rickenella mellea]
MNDSMPFDAYFTDPYDNASPSGSGSHHGSAHDSVGPQLSYDDRMLGLEPSAFCNNVQFEMPSFMMTGGPPLLAPGGGAEVLPPMFSPQGSYTGGTWYDKNAEIKYYNQDGAAMVPPPSASLTSHPFTFPDASPSRSINPTSLSLSQYPSPPLPLPLPSHPSSFSVSPKGLPIYSASGFDMLSILSRVATRPSPKIVLGPVDLTCSFVVVDVRRHDSPIVYASPSFCALTGYAENEVLGRNCRFLQSPDGAPLERGERRRYTSADAVSYLKRCLGADKECQVSLINYRKDGGAFINLVTVIPVPAGEYNPDGSPGDDIAYHVGFQVDLTEQPHAILQRLHDGSYIVNYSNSASGPVSVPQAVGHGLRALSSGMSKDLRTLLADQKFQKSLNFSMSTIAPNTAISTSSASADHKSTGSSGTTEAPDLLSTLNLLLLEHGPDFVHVLSLKGYFLYVSPSVRKVLGYEAAELVGKSITEYCHPSDVVPLIRELKESSAPSGGGGGHTGMGNVASGGSVAEIMAMGGLQQQQQQRESLPFNFDNIVGGGGSSSTSQFASSSSTSSSYPPSQFVPSHFNTLNGPHLPNISTSTSHHPHHQNAHAHPKTVDLLFRARAKSGAYVWVECLGRLHVEPGKGRKAVVLSGRVRSMPGLAWESVCRAGGLSVNTAAAGLGGGDAMKVEDARERERVGDSPPRPSTADGGLSPSHSSPSSQNQTQTQTQNHSVLHPQPPQPHQKQKQKEKEQEFWGMLSREGTFLVAGAGVRDVLGWGAGEMIGRCLREFVGGPSPSATSGGATGGGGGGGGGAGQRRKQQQQQMEERRPGSSGSVRSSSSRSESGSGRGSPPGISGASLHAAETQTLQRLKDGLVRASAAADLSPPPPPPPPSHPNAKHINSNNNSSADGVSQVDNGEAVKVRCEMRRRDGGRVPLEVVFYPSAPSGLPASSSSVAETGALRKGKGVKGKGAAMGMGMGMRPPRAPVVCQFKVIGEAGTDGMANTNGMAPMPMGSSFPSSSSLSGAISDAHMASSSLGANANANANAAPGRIVHAHGTNVFEELEVGRETSWQYELQQLKFANRRLMEEVEALEAQVAGGSSGGSGGSDAGSASGDGVGAGPSASPIEVQAQAEQQVSHPHNILPPLPPIKTVGLSASPSTPYALSAPPYITPSPAQQQLANALAMSHAHAQHEQHGQQTHQPHPQQHPQHGHEHGRRRPHSQSLSLRMPGGGAGTAYQHVSASATSLGKRPWDAMNASISPT